MIVQLLWCDKYIKNYFEKLGFQIKIISQRFEIDEDNIVIVGNEKEQIKDGKNVYLFYSDIYPFTTLQKCDRLMLYLSEKSFEGIILGNSHARHGILPYLMDGNWVNFALSCQDIEKNIQTVYHVIKRYPRRFSELKYILFDLYDYCYFNYELQYSENLKKYYEWGGYASDIAVDLTEKIKFLPDWLVSQEQKYAKFNYKMPDERKHIIKNGKVSEIDVLASKIMQKFFDKSWKKNCDLLCEFVKRMNVLNVNIFFTLIPRIGEYEKKERELDFIKDRKREFYKGLSGLEKDNFCFINFKEKLKFSEKLYYDCEHLNYKGACKLTEIINRMVYFCE